MIYSLKSIKIFDVVAVCPAAMEVGSERRVRVAENLEVKNGVQNYKCV